MWVQTVPEVLAQVSPHQYSASTPAVGYMGGLTLIGERKDLGMEKLSFKLVGFQDLRA